MNKKRVKLAVIRTNQGEKCPFGLNIPFGCKSAGNTITRMAPLSILGDESTAEEQQELAKANKSLMLLESSGMRCDYAGKLLKDKDAVECNWGGTAPGVSEDGLAASPFYSKVYDNVAYDGLYSFPLGWYGDNNISRNLYYGAYSAQGSAETNLKKVANVQSDIKDAVENYVESYEAPKDICFKNAYEGDMLISNILEWDDYGSWGEWKPDELTSLSDEEIINEFANFRGEDWANRAVEWVAKGFPPIILVSGDEGEMIGDGRGRVSVAVGLGIEYLPIVVLNQDKNGNICYNNNE